jgi:hypothetical protein
VGCRAAGAFTGRCPHGDRRRSQPADIRTASLREVAIKSGLGRADFRADARFLRRGLLDNGYDELAITSEHAVAIANLPPIHEDPFDRGHPAVDCRPDCRPIPRTDTQGLILLHPRRKDDGCPRPSPGQAPGGRGLLVKDRKDLRGAVYKR